MEGAPSQKVWCTVRSDWRYLLKSFLTASPGGKQDRDGVTYLQAIDVARHLQQYLKGTYNIKGYVEVPKGNQLEALYESNFPPQRESGGEWISDGGPDAKRGLDGYYFELREDGQPDKHGAERARERFPFRLVIFDEGAGSKLRPEFAEGVE